MNDPLLGPLEYDDAHDGWVSAPRAIPVLGNHECFFALVAYPEDPRPDELRAAIQNLLAAGPSLLSAALPHLLAYRKDMLSLYPPDEEHPLDLQPPDAIWSHVQFGETFYVRRRADGDVEDGIYLSLECECDWEPEHGLQLVIRNGQMISKLGPFDSHLTNTDACADSSLVGVVYRRLG
jgi:hypothetical protein